jgi:hypothetical protein
LQLEDWIATDARAQRLSADRAALVGLRQTLRAPAGQPVRCGGLHSRPGSSIARLDRMVRGAPCGQWRPGPVGRFNEALLRARGDRRRPHDALAILKPVLALRYSEIAARLARTAGLGAAASRGTAGMVGAGVTCTGPATRVGHCLQHPSRLFQRDQGAPVGAVC